MKLVFVYNADSGFFSSVADSLHKTFSPQTYQCNLCALTYGSVSMKKEWKDFIESLKLETKFLHKDEFEKKFEYKTSFPVILIEKSGKISILINSRSLNSIGSLGELIQLVKKKISLL